MHDLISMYFMTFTLINAFAERVEVNWKFSTLQSAPTGVGQWPVKHSPTMLSKTRPLLVISVGPNTSAECSNKPTFYNCL